MSANKMSCTHTEPSVHLARMLTGPENLFTANRLCVYCGNNACGRAIQQSAAVRMPHGQWDVPQSELFTILLRSEWVWAMLSFFRWFHSNEKQTTAMIEFELDLIDGVRKLSTHTHTRDRPLYRSGNNLKESSIFFNVKMRSFSYF